MNFDLQNNDDVLLDRLIDGELSADERRRLIASLDAQTDGWRRCAIAFLEAQSWRGAMRQVVHEPCTKLPASSVTPALDSYSQPTRTRTKLAASYTTELAATAKSAPAGRTKLAASFTWLATAAAVLVAFSLGWRMNGRENVAAELLVDSEAAVGAGQIATAPAEKAAGLPNADEITLVVQDANGQPHRVQVPLVEGHRLGAQFGNSPQWAPPELRRQLAEQGMDLQARRRYAPLYFEQEDGVVPMVVPVDDAVITPVSRTMY